MAPRIEVRTRDPDLGLSLLLWVADLVDEFLARDLRVRFVIDDDGLAGRPWRNGLRGGPLADARVEQAADEVRLLCSSSALVLRRRPMVEAVRKGLVRLGWCREMTSIDHFRVVRQQRRVRDLVRRALGVSRPEPPCRFLLRADDFPTTAATLDDYARFHDVAAEHGVPYLLAVTPFLDRGEGRGRLTDAEVETLHRGSRQSVELALHGFTHRSRYRNFNSELVSLPAGALAEELDRAEEELRAKGLQNIGFVAPFNSYDPLTLSVLAERFALITGGPESVLSVGYRAGPSFLMGRLYVPSYRHAYDLTLSDLPRLDRLRAEAGGLVVPITLHWANEGRDGLRSFRALCARIAGATLSWSDYLGQAEQLRAIIASPISVIR